MRSGPMKWSGGGSVPYYWMGFFQNGGRPYDDAIRPHFEAQGF